MSVERMRWSQASHDLQVGERFVRELQPRRKLEEYVPELVGFAEWRKRLMQLFECPDACVVANRTIAMRPRCSFVALRGSISRSASGSRAASR